MDLGTATSSANNDVQRGEITTIPNKQDYPLEPSIKIIKGSMHSKLNVMSDLSELKMMKEDSINNSVRPNNVYSIGTTASDDRSSLSSINTRDIAK